MDDSQMLKGILEGCVLSIIARGETYGYEILQKFESFGFHDLGEGTLYPVLTRLEKKSLIQCRREKSLLGPIRKYYSVTEDGRAYLADFTARYDQITAGADAVLHEQAGQVK